jgi:general secretion pathway protein G
MRRQRGFTLIELLIVVAIIGIIAAIAIPNLLNAVNRGRQKRTMADMKSICMALEAYSADNNFYPQGATGYQSSFVSMVAYIEPTYIKHAPRQDGWGETYWYGNGFTTEGGPQGKGEGYYVVSTGSDRTLDGGLPNAGPQSTFTADIWYANGSFIEWPEGMQTGT